MTDKPRWIENAETYEIDIGFAIMANGDIVTSDGLPRGYHDERVWLEQFGKLPHYRKPTEAEALALSGQNEALARSFAEFKEKSK